MKKITSSFPGLKVLLVEDYFINQEVTKEILEVMSCDVDVAEEGNRALEMARSTDYDFIIMDLQLPGIDGYEVTRKIRKEKKGPQPIIVAVTANALDGDREKCLEAGMDDYISKPMGADKLEEMMRKYFASKMAINP
jgi:CheY-like chemotaxis protein